DSMENGCFYQRICDHALKHRALVVGGRCTWLDVFVHNRQSVRLAPLTHLAQLVGNRQVVVRLPASRSPSVDTTRHGAYSFASSDCIAMSFRTSGSIVTRRHNSASLTRSS